jgi:hypothetical protein
MVGGDMFNGLVPGLITLGVVIMLVIWGMVELILWVWFDDRHDIRSKTKIEPKIELVIENNKVDTVYVYSKKQVKE